jgi:similar to stage IV sporulation protein
MKNNGSFQQYAIRIKVEGFNPEGLLTECLSRGITMKDIRITNDLELFLTLMMQDFERFRMITKNKYQITIIKESGYWPAARRLFRNKGTVAGLVIFALLLYYQSTFVSEIRISGYEKYTETQIRNSLKDAGLYEGCSKRTDLSEVKLHIYRELDNIAWIGVKYTGNLSDISIVEGSETPAPTVDQSKPSSIIADKEGYVEKTIAREGLPAALPGTYVKPGDVLITGIVPLRNTAYGTPEAGLTERYVHADGEVYLRVPYRLTYYQNRYKDITNPTGKRIFGLRVVFGDLKIDTAKYQYTYDNSVRSEKNLFHLIRPIPLSASLVQIKEVEVERQERSKAEITKAANIQMRQAIKEKIPENAQILNKSLKFSPEENIIGVVIMLETLEKIGREKEIVIGNPTD